MTDMTGKVALITGASRGIGAETARVFAGAGARVALCARSDEAVADLAGELGPDRAIAIPCDVARYWEIAAAVDAALQAFGRLDVLIANAGTIEPIARMDAADPEAWGQTIDTNLKGVFHGMHAALVPMLAQGGGTVITVSSGAAHGPVEAWSHYCAAKAGAAMLVRCLHHEFGESGIRSMGLSPGTVATQMQKEIKASGVNPVSRLDWSDHIPPDWPARAMLWMCGPGGDDWLGEEVRLRDEGIRRAAGLVP